MDGDRWTEADWAIVDGDGDEWPTILVQSCEPDMLPQIETIVRKDLNTTWRTASTLYISLN